MKFRSLVVAGAAAAAFAVVAPAAFADSCVGAGCTTTLAGTNAGTLALSVNTPVGAFTGFAPGGTASATGAIAITSTNANWHLAVTDANSAGGHQGHLLKAASGCTGSEAFTTHNVTVDASGLVGSGITQNTGVAIDNTSKVVAEYTGGTALPVSADVVTTAYSLALDSTETLLNGCAYTMTATYTLT
jgi:hypothetical protein